MNASEALPTPVAKPLPGGCWVRGTVVEADRARMTAAFAYKAFTGDFILTARRISEERWPAYALCDSGVEARGVEPLS